MEDIKLTRDIVNEIYNRCLSNQNSEEKIITQGTLDSKYHYFNPSMLSFYEHEIEELLLMLPSINEGKTTFELLCTKEGTRWGTLFDLDKLIVLGKSTQKLCILESTSFKTSELTTNNQLVMSTCILNEIESSYSLKLHSKR